MGGCYRHGNEPSEAQNLETADIFNVETREFYVQLTVSKEGCAAWI
jgi:hypothetical protein